MTIDVRMRRVFVAIDISNEARKAVTEYVTGLRREFANLRVGWELAEKLHLTLKFVGDLDERRIGQLSMVVGKAASENHSYGAEIAGTGVFQNVGNPRILWLGFHDDDGATASIASMLEIECRKIGIKAETRKFSPHLTIARAREPQKALSLAEKHLASKFEPVGFDVREIVIYESELRPTGSVYSKLAAFPLTGRLL